MAATGAKFGLFTSTMLLRCAAVFIMLSVIAAEPPVRCYWCGPLAEQVHRSRRAPACGGDAGAGQATVCEPGLTNCAVVATAPPYVESRFCVKVYQDECYTLFCNTTKTWKMTCPCRGDLCNGPNSEREIEAFAGLAKLVARTHGSRISKRAVAIRQNFVKGNKRERVVYYEDDWDREEVKENPDADAESNLVTNETELVHQNITNTHREEVKENPDADAESNLVTNETELVHQNITNTHREEVKENPDADEKSNLVTNETELVYQNITNTHREEVKENPDADEESNLVTNETKLVHQNITNTHREEVKENPDADKESNLVTKETELVYQNITNTQNEYKLINETETNLLKEDSSKSDYFKGNDNSIEKLDDDTLIISRTMDAKVVNLDDEVILKEDDLQVMNMKSDTEELHIEITPTLAAVIDSATTQSEFGDSTLSDSKETVQEYTSQSEIPTNGSQVFSNKQQETIPTQGDEEDEDKTSGRTTAKAAGVTETSTTTKKDAPVSTITVTTTEPGNNAIRITKYVMGVLNTIGLLFCLLMYIFK